MIFETRINGIPCQCKVTHFAPYVPMRVTGPGFADAEPPEESEFEFEILDSKGNAAPWLMKYVNPQAEEHLFEEFQAARTAEKYDINY